MKQALIAVLLALGAHDAMAQLAVAPGAEFAQPRTAAGFGLVTGGAIARSADWRAHSWSIAAAYLHTRRFGIESEFSAHAGQPAGLLAISTQLHMARTAWQLKVGAGAAQDEQRGPSVFSAGLAAQRAGFRLVINAHHIPELPGVFRDTLVPGPDSLLQHVRIVDREPRPSRDYETSRWVF